MSTEPPPPNPAQSPHDGLIKFAFSDLTRAREYIGSLLPEALNARLEWETLRHEKSSFVSAELAQRFSDLLYSVQIEGQPGLVYVLIEHQSSNDSWMALRLLEYMTAGWVQWLSQHEGATHLPPLIPIVLTHTEHGWHGVTHFHSLFEQTDTFALLKDHLPDFSYILDDLNTQTDAQIRQRVAEPFTALTLLLLRDSRLPIDMAEWLRQSVPDLLRKVWSLTRSRELLAALMRYILSVARFSKGSDITASFGAILDAEAQTLSNTIAEQLIEQGRIDGERKGWLEGERQGRLEGERLGKLEGERLGKLEGAAELRQAIEDICEILGVALNDERLALLAALDLDGLKSLRIAIKQSRAWPETAPGN